MALSHELSVELGGEVVEKHLKKRGKSFLLACPTHLVERLVLLLSAARSRFCSTAFTASSICVENRLPAFIFQLASDMEPSRVL